MAYLKVASILVFAAFGLDDTNSAGSMDKSADKLVDNLAIKLIDRALTEWPQMDLENSALAKAHPDMSPGVLSASGSSLSIARAPLPVTRATFQAPHYQPMSNAQLAGTSPAFARPVHVASGAGPRAVASRSSVVARAEGKNPVAVMDTTMGTMKAELFLDQMPITVSNFIDLAKNGYYDGIHFHRVIPNFMDQFGCPNAKDPKSPKAGTGGPDGGTSFENLATGQMIPRDAGGNIPDELTTKITNAPGTLSMANTGRPNSGGSQFFINVNDNAFLDWFNDQTPSAHPVFGQIVDNMDLAVKISEVPTANDKPVTPIMMKSIKIEGM